MRVITPFFNGFERAAHRLRGGLVMAVLLMLGACATRTLPVQVTRFVEPDFALVPAPRAEVVPAHPELAKDPDFVIFGDMVGERMRRFGFRPADGGEPDVRIRLDYDGRAVETRASVPRIGIGIGAGHAGRHVGIGGSLGTTVATGARRVIHDYRIHLSLVRASDGRVLWEGRAFANGTRLNLKAAFPVMLDALLTEFPGRSGETHTVEVPLKPTRSSRAA